MAAELLLGLRSIECVMQSMTPPLVSKRVLLRLVPAIVATAFSVGSYGRRDYWGAAFGAFWLGYVLLFPRGQEDQTIRLRKARKLLAIGFATLCIAAIWATIIHAY
jgi:hypothetical protein